MSKLKKLACGLALASGAVGAAIAVKKVKSAYKLQMENCTNEMLDVYLGTSTAPDALVFSDFKPGEKRNVDLTHLPLAEHDVVYIRFPECEGRSGYQRTLIYDTDECQCTMHGMIVDYGDKNYDVKLVKIG